jgi:tetratricopeptide (TPR) repeat protein
MVIKRKLHRSGIFGHAVPVVLSATCVILVGCVPTPRQVAVLAPPAAPPVPALPVSPPSPAATIVVRDQACAELRAWSPNATETPQMAAALSGPEAAPPGQPPDPKAESGKKEESKHRQLDKPTLDGSKQSGSSAPVNLAERIPARSIEISASTVAIGEAEKAASSGRTARAAELYAANWRASPDDWPSAFHAVELWSRIGNYMRAEILLREVGASAAATQNDAALKRAHELDEKLSVNGNATAEAARFWRRAFALDAESRYAESVATLQRLQRFDPTAPGYYVREAALFARCGEAARAGDAIARGSAAGVVYGGRWSPARDPAILKLWSDRVFAATIRETLGDAGVEEFEEATKPASLNVQAAR